MSAGLVPSAAARTSARCCWPTTPRIATSFYARRAGTGTTDKELKRLVGVLKLLAVPKMPLAGPPPRDSRFGSPLKLNEVHWVKPKLVAEVNLTWTQDNLLGQVSYQGLREDKPGGGWFGGYLIPSLVLTLTACSDRAAERLCDFRVNATRGLHAAARKKAAEKKARRKAVKRELIDTGSTSFTCAVTSVAARSKKWRTLVGSWCRGHRR